MKTTYFMIFKRYATKIDVPSTLYIATENSDDSLKKNSGNCCQNAKFRSRSPSSV